MRAVKRVLALLSSTAVLAGGLALAAPAAQAFNAVGAYINPATGTNTSVLDMITDGTCTAGTNYLVRVFGNGFPAEGYNVVGNSTQSSASRNGSGYRIPITQTMQTFADEQSPAATLSGEYRFQLVCRTSLDSTVLDDFNAFITFGTPTSYTTPDVSDRKVATTTTLTGSPASPVVQGSDVVLTATLGDAANVLDGGSYQFSANGAPTGAPVPVDANGVASYTASTDALSGPVTFTAEFLPARANSYRGSTGSTAYTVNAPVRDTTTVLTVTPEQTASTPDETTVVTLLAEVTPAGGTAPSAGTVVFRNGTTELARVAFSDGSAELARTFPAETYSFTAEFLANDAFNGSTSTAVARTVHAYLGVSTAQDITTTVEAGALTITVANRTVTLPSPVLDSRGRIFQTEGRINPVTVTDTRAGNPGWTASGQLSDFSETADPAKKINGANLGWTPAVVSNASAQTIVPGATVAPADGAEPGAASTDGLKASPRTLASAAQGFGNGTAVLDAGLALNVPTSTTAGTYTALLTLTAI